MNDNDRRWLSAHSDYDCCAQHHKRGTHKDALCPVIQFRGGKALCEWISAQVKEDKPRKATEQEVVAKAGAALRRYKEAHPEDPGN